MNNDQHIYMPLEHDGLSEDDDDVIFDYRNMQLVNRLYDNSY